jgi:hypothetical protein
LRTTGSSGVSGGGVAPIAARSAFVISPRFGKRRDGSFSRARAATAARAGGMCRAAESRAGSGSFTIRWMRLPMVGASNGRRPVIIS